MSISNVPKALQSYYDADKDMWFLIVPFALSVSSMKAAKKFILEVNVNRMRGLPLGDKREFISKALAALKADKFSQILVNKGDQVAFQSTEKMQPNRNIIDLGAN